MLHCCFFLFVLSNIARPETSCVNILFSYYKDSSLTKKSILKIITNMFDANALCMQKEQNAVGLIGD